MKGLFLRERLAIVLIFCLVSNPLFAAQSATQQATFSVDVATVFELSIDQGFVDFGRMSPGETKWNMPPAGIMVQAKTNCGKPWFLKISNDAPFTSGQNYIPNSNFQWYGWTQGNGKWHGTGENVMSVTPALVYSSGVGEENNLPGGTINFLKFKLKIPNNQAPGNYTTVVKFTMTE